MTWCCHRTVFCDECGGWERFAAGSKGQAKRLATQGGWSLGDRHRCPVCLGKVDSHDWLNAGDTG